MKVKDAIEKVERQQVKTHETAEKYLKKGNEMGDKLALADKNSKQWWRLRTKRNYYYHKSARAEDYAEELKELIYVLKNKDPDDKAVLANEIEFENEYALYGDSAEEWENTISSMIRCDLDDGTSVLAICLRKMPG